MTIISLQCVIPIFTKNLREAFRTVSWGRRIWLRIYAATRFPLVPIYGGFPVKLKTYVGKPIPYDGSLTPDQLQLKVDNTFILSYLAQDELKD